MLAAVEAPLPGDDWKVPVDAEAATCEEQVVSASAVHADTPIGDDRECQEQEPTPKVRIQSRL